MKFKFYEREFDSNEQKTINKYFQSSIKKVSLLNVRNILGIIFSIGLLTSIIILTIVMI